MPSKREKEVDQLVRQNQGLVKKQANRYSKGAREAYEDIEAAGMVGLVKAAQRFDSSKGFKFSSIAVPWIRGEILHYLRGKGGNPRVPRSWQDLYMKGYRLPDAEAAAKCNITIAQWQEIKAACSVWVGEWQPSYEKSIDYPDLEDLPQNSELAAARSHLHTWLHDLNAADRTLIKSVFFQGEAIGRQRSQVAQILRSLECPS